MAFQQMMNNAQQMQQFQQQFGQFQQQFSGNGQMNPQAIVQQKLNSGEMSQQQFEQLRQMANMMMGTNN
jgi:3-methyladenine DNA glycosylase Tag